MSTSSRWFSISELLVEMDVAIAAVAVADADEFESVEVFKWFEVMVDEVPGIPVKLSFIELFSDSIENGKLAITELPRLTCCELILYGAIFNFLASRRSFFCCITSLRWSSLFLVFKFSISSLRLMSDWLHPAQSFRAIPDDVDGIRCDAERSEHEIVSFSQNLIEKL